MISYIVPVYNSAAYLHTCMDSLLAQDVEMEIILVDDGSMDESGAMCDAYAIQDARVRVIHKENGGQASARNAGLDAARGKYVWFIDSDDWIEPDAGRLMRAAIGAGDYDIAVCGLVSDYLDSNDQKQHSQTDKKVYLDGEISQAILSIERQELMPYPVNKLYRREFLEQTGVRFEKIRGPVEDILYALDIVPQAKSIVMVDRMLYHYVQINSNSTVRRYFDGLFEMGLRVNRKRKALYKTFGLSGEEAKDICAKICFQQNFHSIKNLYRRHGKEMKAIRRDVWKRIICDAEIRDEIRRSAAYMTEAKLVQMAVSSGSAAVANAFFALLMGARRHGGSLYFHLRRRMILKRK